MIHRKNDFPHTIIRKKRGNEGKPFTWYGIAKIGFRIAFQFVVYLKSLNQKNLNQCVRYTQSEFNYRLFLFLPFIVFYRTTAHRWRDKFNLNRCKAINQRPMPSWPHRFEFTKMTTNVPINDVILYIVDKINSFNSTDGIYSEILVPNNFHGIHNEFRSHVSMHIIPIMNWL